MKKFLYLRINALVAIIAFILLLVYTIISAMKASITHRSLFVLFSIIVFGLPILHNVLIIFIYRRYYPDREISKSLRIANVILNIICIFDLIVFLITTGTSFTRQYPEDEKLKAYMDFTLTALLCITTTVQIVGSFRLIKIVRENAQLQLENSFV